MNPIKCIFFNRVFHPVKNKINTDVFACLYITVTPKIKSQTIKCKLFLYNIYKVSGIKINHIPAVSGFDPAVIKSSVPKT